MPRLRAKPPALKSPRLPAMAARRANSRPSVTTPDRASRSPISREVAPLGIVTRTRPVPDPWKGWKSAAASRTAAPATSNAATAAMRRPPWRGRRGAGGGAGASRAAKRGGSGGRARAGGEAPAPRARAPGRRRRGGRLARREARRRRRQVAAERLGGAPATAAVAVGHGRRPRQPGAGGRRIVVGGRERVAVRRVAGLGL